MSAVGTTGRIASFVAVLGVVLAAGLGLGRVVGPVDVEPVAHDESHAEPHGESHGAAHEDAASATGLESTSSGYTLRLAADRLPAGRQRLSFQILGPDGAAVTSYDVQHEKELHLIVVRRDLTGFQHVHPVRAPDGTWSVEVDLTPGVWRVLADAAPSGAAPVVLGADLAVPGEFAPEPLGPEELAADADGFDVTLAGQLSAGAETELSLTVQRGGEPVTDLEPYLGASGHLVALRAGDLGYLHVHPDEASGSGPAIRFHTAFPTAGTYRLFLDFQHRGVVRTAAFTVHVDGDAEGAGHEH